jgi:hypothetical protein
MVVATTLWVESGDGGVVARQPVLFVDDPQPVEVV